MYPLPLIQRLGWWIERLRWPSIPTEAWPLIISVAAVGIGFFQWWLSHRSATSKRDAELFAWSKEVIGRMCLVEAHCRALSRGKPSTFPIEHLAAELSGLADTGRLFFPNTDGFRAKVLDEVIRSYRAADIVSGDPRFAGELAPKIRRSCREFVRHMQGEMSKSLRRKVTEASGPGDEIGWNPDDWWAELSAVRSELRASHPNLHTSALVMGQTELATMTFPELVSKLDGTFQRKAASQPATL